MLSVLEIGLIVRALLRYRKRFACHLRSVQQLHNK
jgi:hypothetical protein